jgi:hypothetical protein
MKAKFAVVNYTSSDFSIKGIVDVPFMFADGNGPTPNPAFGGVLFSRSTSFSIKKMHSRVRTRCTHPAVFFEENRVDLEKK